MPAAASPGGPTGDPVRARASTSAAGGTDPSHAGPSGASPPGPTTAFHAGPTAAFHAGGDRTGVLLCHGFTGSPASLRGLAEELAREGRSVALPRLPGHGTHWRELDVTEPDDWYRCVEAELLRLGRRCDRVVVLGLSMGGALALRLAQCHGEQVAGLVLINPAVRSNDRRLLTLPLLRRLVRTIPGIGNDVHRPGADEHGYDRTPLRALAAMVRWWRVVRRDLPRVAQPVLLIRSATDHVVDPGSARQILTQVGSRELSEVVLTRSWHVATLDHDAEEITRMVSAFVGRHGSPDHRSNGSNPPRGSSNGASPDRGGPDDPGPAVPGPTVPGHHVQPGTPQ